MVQLPPRYHFGGGWQSRAGIHILVVVLVINRARKEMTPKQNDPQQRYLWTRETITICYIFEFRQRKRVTCVIFEFRLRKPLQFVTFLNLGADNQYIVCEKCVVC